MRAYSLLYSAIVSGWLLTEAVGSTPDHAELRVNGRASASSIEPRAVVRAGPVEQPTRHEEIAPASAMASSSVPLFVRVLGFTP